MILLHLALEVQVEVETVQDQAQTQQLELLTEVVEVAVDGILLVVLMYLKFKVRLVVQV